MLNAPTFAIEYGSKGVVRHASSSSASGVWLAYGRSISSAVESATVFILAATDTKSESVKPQVGFVQIHSLETKRLLSALSVLVEPDGDGYIAQTVDLPLYGAGETANEAIEMLKSEVESLHADLMEDDNFSAEWLTRKKLLSAIVVD